MTHQGEFDFETDGASERGYTRWLTGRRMAVHELAQRLNLPLGHKVEVWLRGGVRLRGMLRLRESLLFIDEENVRHLQLMIDRVDFSLAEMESCVRLD